MKTSFRNILGVIGLVVAFAVCGGARGEQVTYGVRSGAEFADDFGHLCGGAF